MAFNVVSTSDPIVALYRDRLLKQKRAAFLFDRFTGETSNRDDAMVGRHAWPKEVVSSDKPVLVIPMGNGKYSPGAVGTNLHRMGMVVEYNTDGVAGDAVAKGTGGLDTIKYHELYTHRRRLVKWERAGRWNEELGGDWARQLVADVGPALTDLHMRDKSWKGVAYALYYGHSYHIVYDTNIGVGKSTAVAHGGLGIIVRLHPNFCIPGLPSGTGAGYRYATWSPTHATYMASLAYNIASMTDENKFKCGLSWLRIVEQELQSKCRVGRMNPVAGQPEFWLAVTPAQWMQLMADPYLQGQIIYDNPKAIDQSEAYLGNASFRWGGLRVFRGGYRGPTRVYCYKATDTLATTNGPGLTTTPATATRVVFGFVSDAFVPYEMVDSSVSESYATDDGTKPFLSRDVAIGGAFRPMIHGLQRYKAEFLKEDEDFENQIQVALDSDYGFSRKDYYNNPVPASATTVENDTSVLFASYSPNLIVA
jgi:hypothetical protein